MCAGASPTAELNNFRLSCADNLNTPTASAESLASQANRVAEAVGVFKLSAQDNLKMFNSAVGEAPAHMRG